MGALCQSQGSRPDFGDGSTTGDAAAKRGAEIIAPDVDFFASGC
jgi:hypothetical protein